MIACRGGSKLGPLPCAKLGSLQNEHIYVVLGQLIMDGLMGLPRASHRPCIRGLLVIRQRRILHYIMFGLHKTTFFGFILRDKLVHSPSRFSFSRIFHCIAIIQHGNQMVSVPNGITMVPLLNDRLLVWDATCVDTFSPSHLSVTASEVCAAANQAEQAKIQKYSYLTSHAYHSLHLKLLVSAALAPCLS